jgi:hypothetical protein
MRLWAMRAPPKTTISPAMSLGAVVRDPAAVAGEPVDDPVAAREAVHRDRHVEDQPAALGHHATR